MSTVERRFTPEQQAAIERREGPMLLSANAGSGKTTVLAERFVRAVLEDGIAPGRLLAITFTEKAAGELRSRLRERLTALGERAAARDMEAAWVSTIHGFCARILRAHAVAAGLDPAFTVLDEATARAVRASSWEDVLATFLRDEGGAGPRPAALDLVAGYGPDRLFRAVATVHDELRSRGHAAPALPPVAPRGDVAQARDALRAAAASAAAGLGAGEDGPKSVAEGRAALAACLDLLDAGGPAPADAARVELKRNAGALKSGACDAYRDALAAFTAARDDAAALEPWRLMDELLGLFGERYAAAKRERSALDYDDLELELRGLFERAPAVAHSYAERFERVMVDEFQDTNPLQLAVLRHLDRDNVFTVGDELQSIYGFRHADVEVFRARRDEHEARGHHAQLATNWRSQPELLETINAAFAGAHPGYVPLVPGRDPTPGDAPRTELLLVDAAWDEEGLDEVLAARVGAGMPSARLSRQAEARAVARRVRALVEDEGFAPGDVAVLLRAATDLHVFERALELEGLPTLASGGRGFWLRQPVQDLCAYLGALVNPRDGLALYGTLASPLCGVSSDALAVLADAARVAGIAPWDVLVGAFCEDGPPLGVPPRDRERLAAFCPRFAAERVRAPRHALDDLIARAVAASDYDLHVLRLPGGRRRLANVHKLERLAAAYEATHGRDLRGFIDHATAELEADAREPEAPIDPGDRSAVALMTIHAAKGLEFPVVVMADLGRRGNAQQPDVLVGHGERPRAGLRLVRPGVGGSATTFDYDDLCKEANARDAREERRVLHVGMTRAEERLVLSGVQRLGRDWPDESATSCPLAYLGPRLGPELPLRLAEVPEVDLDEDRPDGRLRLRARRVAPDTAAATLGIDATAGQLSLAVDGGPAPPATAPPPRAPGAPAYPDHVAGGTPAAGSPGHAAPASSPAAPSTLSYSALADHDRCGYRYYLQRILRLPAETDDRLARGPGGGLDPRVRGSIVHLALERLDLAAPREDALPDDERLDRLAARFGASDLTDVEREDLRGLVATFLDHPLHARLAAAAHQGRLRREHGFAYPLGDLLLNGFVDVRAREPDGSALVVDYKTDRLDDDAADLEALVERDYGAQRRIYALAELRAGAPAVEVVHLFLERPGAPVSVTYAAGDMPAIEAELLERAAAVLAGRFPVSPAPHATLCQGCPGRGSLCSWPREATEREAA